MSGFQTEDYVSNTCEIVEVKTVSGGYVATIFRKPPNGGMFAAFPSLTCQLIKLSFLTIFPFFASEFEVQGACLVCNELKREYDWYGNLRRYRTLRIVTSSGHVLDIERQGTNGILLITLSLRFVTWKKILKHKYTISPLSRLQDENTRIPVDSSTDGERLSEVRSTKYSSTV